ncbi:MAG: hypothetical protein RQ753_01970 [Desulfurivibrionaceae bacterium]|nr:hypothetical protein [Desulfurivibrionaceae bacterium]
MTFSCKNHDFDTDICKKLKSRCIMGRRGCVLEGRVALSEATEKLIAALEEELAKKRKERCAGS